MHTYPHVHTPFTHPTHHSHIPHTHPHVHTPLTHSHTADGEAEEIDKNLKQIKDDSREETVQSLLPSFETVVDGGDTTPQKTVSNGDGDGDREDIESMDLGLSKGNTADADRTHDDEWNDGLGGNEINNDEKNSFVKQPAGGGQQPVEHLPSKKPPDGK